MRKFLYSRWFFGFLALVILLDLATDLVAFVYGWKPLHEIMVGLECIAAFLAVSMFLDLHRRVKVHGPHTGG
jgi:hypothetical protein